MKVSVIAYPNSKKIRIEYVNQPPLEGKANKAVIEALAKYFKVKRKSVLLLSGEKSKIKLFEIINH